MEQEFTVEQCEARLKSVNKECHAVACISGIVSGTLACLMARALIVSDGFVLLISALGMVAHSAALAFELYTLRKEKANVLEYIEKLKQNGVDEAIQRAKDNTRLEK